MLVTFYETVINDGLVKSPKKAGFVIASEARQSHNLLNLQGIATAPCASQWPSRILCEFINLTA